MSPYRALTRALHPFEVFSLGLAFITGVPLLLGDAKPGSISEPLGPIAENLWAFGLSFGSGLALLGILWKNRLIGILIEQVGLMCAGIAVIFYAIAIVLYAQNWSVAAPTALVASFGISCCWRWVQLEKLIRYARKRAREGGGS